ncbi:Uncharacterized protein ChrSV_4343 [Chromobacterium vaccinii]|nr:Uncharacterized protein ChrSW_4343 [Chromobacterium vaccinii]QND91800.1 Uncharacterized protein ChrSV_4343 [Chromobacterium vaccinii]
MKYLLNAYGIDIFSIIHQWHFDRLLNSDEKEALPLAPQAAGAGGFWRFHCDGMSVQQ